MPNVHRKGRKLFAVRLDEKQRKILEEAAAAYHSKDLSSFVISTIMDKAKKKGIKV